MERPACVTIGNFDGVHCGHMALLGEVREISAQNEFETVLITFWPHPACALQRSPFPGLLTSRNRKLSFLEKAGIKKILEIPFTMDFAALSPTAFLRDWILPLNVRHIAIGHDFCFGRDKAGDHDLLTRLGQEHGFTVSRAHGLEMDGQIISSSRIRQFLREGDIKSANQMLGRPYALEGYVGHGFARGRELGFPTANLENTETMLPANGVYATLVRHDGALLPAVTSVGQNPTFNGNTTRVESYILDQRLDIYDQELEVNFVERLRGEKKFPNPEALAAQIKADIAAARKILGHGV